MGIWRSGAVGLGLLLAGAGPAAAITIAPDTNAETLAQALVPTASGVDVRSVRLLAHQGPSGGASSGHYVNPSGTYGIGDGVVLSSGDVRDYADGASTSNDLTTSWWIEANAEQRGLASAVTGEPAWRYFDATELEIRFDVLPGHSQLEFDVVFGSEEWPEFLGSKFVDGFGIFLDGVNQAFLGGHAVNLEHPYVGSVAGTELDGVLAPGGDPVVRFSIPLPEPSEESSEEGAHTLTFLVFDTSDTILDTTVFLSGVSAVVPMPTPEPSTALMLATGLVSLGVARRRSRR